MPSEPHPRRSVAVTGAAGALGRRVVALLHDADAVGDIVAVDLLEPEAPPSNVRFAAADLATTDLKPLLEGAATLVHLAFTVSAGLDDDATARANVEGTRRVLDAAGSVGVDHVVVVSSATVYGAWPSNPVPLTEDAPVRPNPGFDYAVQKAEIERLAAEWAGEHPGATVAVLRPTTALAEDEESWLSRSLRSTSGVRAGDDDPPAQFVHLDDLAAAVVLAATTRLDGPYNVAADGWVSGDTVRALAGAPPKLPVPEWLATRVAGWTWRWRIGRTPPGLIPYTIHPWVVANDRLKAAGWTPRSSNEEAFVVTHPGSPWSRLSPQRRQELALAAAAVTLTGLATGALVAVRRLRRRRRTA